MKLTEKIHLFKIDFEITLSPERKLSRFVNVIMIIDDNITLIDTGVKGTEEIIFDYIKKLDRHHSDIQKIIISHSHPDHIGSAARIKELTGCKVFAHENEKEWIENIEKQNQLRPVPGFFTLVDKPVIVDELINDGQIMKTGSGLTLRFNKAAGHSRGSLNILFEEDKILFTADSIPLKNDIPNYDDYIELMDSLVKIKNRRDFTILLTSWTPPLIEPDRISEIINAGEMYMKRINAVVMECHKNKENDKLESCKSVIGKLGLPMFFVNPITDKAFRSHLQESR